MLIYDFMLLLGCVFVLFVLLVLFGAFWRFFVHVKSFRKKKNKRFKTVLMISFILLLNNVDLFQKSNGILKKVFRCTDTFGYI